MLLLIFAIMVLIVTALVVYAIGIVGLPDPFGRLIQALVVLFAAVIICNHAGMLS